MCRNALAIRFSEYRLFFMPSLLVGGLQLS